MNLLVSHFMQDLPPEIIEYIANLDNQVWHILVHVYKFLYLKTMDQTYVDDLKRKFLLVSTSSPDIKYNTLYTYKYNNKFHNNYILVYYLPNGDLHTFENPCIAKCEFEEQHLEIWYKDNKVHRDNDEPAIIQTSTNESNCFCVDSLKVFESINDINTIPTWFDITNCKIWVKNNTLCQEREYFLAVIDDDTIFYISRLNGSLVLKS